MKTDERHRLIAGILRQQAEVTVEELMLACDASGPTIRRDLETLAGNGVLRRIHGGARSLIGQGQNPGYGLRELEDRDAKKRIAAAVAGLLMERELQFLSQATERPARPYVAIIGGAKVSDKIGVLLKLVTLVDKLLIGGGMANTFLAAQGFDMQKSLVETDQIETARDIMAQGAQRGVTVMLPSDVAVAEEFVREAGRNVSPLARAKLHGVLPGTMALDIGAETAKDYALALEDAKLIVWNGPMGVFEFPNFAVGTMLIADAVGSNNGTTIVGGGETVAAVNLAGVAKRISHISTGGGASLEFLEGKTLPGVAALLDA
jgi:3-phosphoglycerate kinase